MADGFAIAQVTPYAWEARHGVNEYVRRVSDELAARGHRVLIVAPSHSQALVRDSRRAIRAARDGRGSLLGDEGSPRVLGAGEVLQLTPSRRRQLPIDVARTIEEALTVAPLDFVHVHEPFAPSAASAALRHSRALNVGAFHAPTERTLSTQLGRRVVELFFGRLDARTASYHATRDLMESYFPADYRVITPGAAPAPDRRAKNAAAHVAFVEDEERPALRLFLRALRGLSLDRDWRVTVWSSTGASTHPALRRELRERVDFAGPDDCSMTELLAGADVLVAASSGAGPAPGLLLYAIAAGAVPLAARLPVYEEVVEDGEYGLLFEPGDLDTLSAQLERLVGDADLRDRLRRQAEPQRRRLTWTRVADELEEVYGAVAARRHPDDGAADVRARLAKRQLIDVDLHMHTDHSHDCAVPVEELLATAKEQGLGAIAITDHNEISGAHEARPRPTGSR